MKLLEGTVFSRVYQFVHSVRSYVTITHDALDLTIQGTPGLPCTGTHPPSPARPPGPLLVSSGGQDWRPVQICSLENPLPVTPVG